MKSENVGDMKKQKIQKNVGNQRKQVIDKRRKSNKVGCWGKWEIKKKQEIKKVGTKKAGNPKIGN